MLANNYSSIMIGWVAIAAALVPK